MFLWEHGGVYNIPFFIPGMFCSVHFIQVRNNLILKERLKAWELHAFDDYHIFDAK